MTDTTEATGVDLFGAPATEAEGVTHLQPTVESLPAVARDAPYYLGVTTMTAPLAPAPPVVQEGPGALLSAIVQLARDPSVDVTKLQALLGMQERMEGRQAELEFNRALSRLPPMHVKKNGLIDLTSKEDKAKNVSRKPVAFAKWEDMAAVIEPILDAEGFRLMFESVPRPGEGGGLTVTGMLLHRDGHCRSASIPLPLDTGPGRNNLQAYGSTLSYGKRYTAEMLLNIVRDGQDDDGKTGGAMPLTEEEVDAVRGALMAAKLTDPEKITRFLHTHTNYHADSPEAILQSDLTRIMNLLTIMARQKGKGE